jgi:RHS repeat-associated protein
MQENLIAGNDDSDKSLTRYIYSNHLQSSALELDIKGDVISYEEYHPYGTTSYHAKNDTIKATAKRYRYTGKERDEESGLYYHGARYYIPWLCRWCAVDPLESKYAGLSSYHYSFNNPVMFNDPSGMGPEKLNYKIVTEITNPDTNEKIKIPAQAEWDEIREGKKVHVVTLVSEMDSEASNSVPNKTKTEEKKEKQKSEKEKKEVSKKASHNSSSQSSSPHKTPQTPAKKPSPVPVKKTFLQKAIGVLDAVTDWLPGSGVKDVYRGIKSGNGWQIAGGVLSLGLDLVTGGLGGAARKIATKIGGKLASVVAKSGLGKAVAAGGKKTFAAVGAFFGFTQKHHLIPNQIHKLYRDSFNASKWWQNHADNLMRLPIPFHGNHPAYNHYVQTQFQNLLERFHGNIPLDELIKMQTRFRDDIERIMKNYPSMNLNDYYKKLGYSQPAL